MGIIVEKLELLKLTPELALKVNTMCPLLAERDPKGGRVRFLQNHIRQGTFIPPIWKVARVRGEDDWYRVNGQHSSTALCTVHPDEFPKELMVIVIRYLIDSLSVDGPILWEESDNPESTRTDTDVMAVYKAHHPEELADISKTHLVKATGGVAYYAKEEEETALPRWIRRKAGNYLDEPEVLDFALWLHRWEGVRGSWLMKKASVVAEMFANRQENPELATEFWDYVITESHPDPNDPTRKLAKLCGTWKGSFKRIPLEAYREKAHEAWVRFVKANRNGR